MKINYLKVVPLILVALVSPTLSQAQTTATWSGTTGNVSTGTNWSTGSAPALDSSLYLTNYTGGYATYAVNFDTAWSTAPSVYGITVGAIAGAASSDQSHHYSITNATGTPLAIGAGGITLQRTNGTGGNLFLSTAINVTADQTWNNNIAGDSESLIRLDNDLSGVGNITKTGAGTVRFNGGTSTGWTGKMTINAGSVLFSGASQVNRLGASVNLNNSSATSIKFEGISGQTVTFSTNVALGNTGTSRYAFAGNDSNIAASETIVLAGNITSAAAMTNAIEFNSSNSNGDLTGNTVTYHIAGNNSGLTNTSANFVNNQVGGFYVGAVVGASKVVLDTNNALGTNNSLGLSLGALNSGQGAAGRSSALLLRDGVNYTGGIVVANNAYTNSIIEDAYLGLEGGGKSKITGTVIFSTAGTTTPGARLHLVAGTGGTLTMAGYISDMYSNATATNSATSVTIEGGGRVVLVGGQYGLGNHYNAKTIVSTNSTLQLSNTSGSATAITSATASAVSIEVMNTGRLTGTGTTSGLVQTDGGQSTIGAGDFGVVGALSLTGGLDATAGLKLEVDINALTCDVLHLGGGAFTLGNTITIDFTNLGSIVQGNVYTFADGTGTWTKLAGTTFSVTTADGYGLDTTYGTNGILFDTTSDTFSVKFVPEPNAMALVGIAGFMLLGTRLFRSRSRFTRA